jgi:ABC-type sugar transport system permease subunit
MKTLFIKKRSKLRMAIITRSLIGYSFILPSLVVLGFFTIYSIVFLFKLSFTKYSILTGDSVFIGLKNYYYILIRDSVFHMALKNTFVFVVGVVLFSTLLGLMAAVLIQQIHKRLQTVMKVIFYIPVVTSAVAAALIWVFLYLPQFGLINYVLAHYLEVSRPPSWLFDKNWALPAIMMVSVWRQFGFNMVIFLAGLAGIPDVCYEAAMIDGASRPKIFWHVTLPLLRPTTFFVIVTGVIRAFQVFAPVNVMTRGGPGHATEVIVYHLYQTSFQFLRIGRATAMAVVLFGITLVMTLVQLRVIRSSLA